MTATADALLQKAGLTETLSADAIGIRMIDHPAMPIHQIRAAASPYAQLCDITVQAVNAGGKEGVSVLGGQDAARGFKICSSASKGGVNKGINHAQEYENIHEAKKQILKARTRRKLGQRELARLIVSNLFPDLQKEDATKKAEAVRQQLRK